MASLTDFLSNPAVQLGANLLNQYQLNQGAKGAANTINQGFNSAANTLTNFGNQSIQAIQSGADQAKQSLTDYSGKASGYQQPYYDAGLQALSDFRSLLANPSSVMNDPGIQFQKNQGLEAITRAAEHNNLLNSSARLNAANDYAQNFASTNLDSALNRQLPLLGAGQTAGNNLSNINQNTGISLANLAQNTGQNIANVNQGLGQGLATLQLGQAENLSAKNITDSIRNTGLLDTLTSPEGIQAVTGIADAVGGLINGEGTGGLGEAVSSLFGGGSSGATTYAAGEWGNAAIPGGVQATPLDGASTTGATTASSNTPTLSTTPAAINAANIGLGILSSDAWQKSGAQNQGGEIGGAVGTVAGSLLPILGPVTASAGAIIGGTIGNFAGAVAQDLTGNSDSDWAIRYDANGEGLAGKGSFTTALGTFGFSANQTRNMGEAEKAEITNKIQEQFTQIDQGIANALTPDELNAVKQYMTGFEAGSGSNATAKDYSRDPVLAFTKKRMEALKSTLTPERMAETGFDKVLEGYNAQFPDPPDQKTAIKAAKVAYQLSAGKGSLINEADMIDAQYPGFLDAVQATAKNTEFDEATIRNASDKYLTAANMVMGKMQDATRYRV